MYYKLLPNYSPEVWKFYLIKVLLFVSLVKAVKELKPYQDIIGVKSVLHHDFLRGFLNDELELNVRERLNLNGVNIRSGDVRTDLIIIKVVKLITALLFPIFTREISSSEGGSLISLAELDIDLTAERCRAEVRKEFEYFVSGQTDIKLDSLVMYIWNLLFNSTIEFDDEVKGMIQRRVLEILEFVGVDSSSTNRNRKWVVNFIFTQDVMMLAFPESAFRDRERVVYGLNEYVLLSDTVSVKQDGRNRDFPPLSELPYDFVRGRSSGISEPYFRRFYSIVNTFE